jgi:hypothetical protein
LFSLARRLRGKITVPVFGPSVWLVDGPSKKQVFWSMAMVQIAKFLFRGESGAHTTFEQNSPNDQKYNTSLNGLILKKEK